jgi:cytochrome c peroxidase
MKKQSFLVATGLVFAILAGCLIYRTSDSFTASSVAIAASNQPLPDQIREPIRPILPAAGLNRDKVILGRRLFHDQRLSGNDTISCASCHDLGKGGTDHRPHSIGMNGDVVTLNAPTVFNSSLNFKQFWDGRAATLEEQIDGPIQDPTEMNSTWDAVLTKLRGDSSYLSSFVQLYPEGIQISSVKDALATFERSLLTPNSRFDLYLRGDAQAITEEEKEGYHLFKSYGCVSCHQGTGVGGNMFATFGAMADYFAERKQINHADLGRFNITGKEADRYRFKVPGLRNVALTAPYFHDGSALTLDSAVDIMAKYQLGRQMPSADNQLIVRFLYSLTGEYEGVLLK